MDLQQRTGEGLRELALFAGAGGGILGGKLLGWRTVCAVEWDTYAASVLCARQNDGVIAPFPIWNDVQTFDGTQWRGRIDVVSGGFPCQDISAAGKGAGIDGARSGMWFHMARIIGEVRPQFAFVENSPMLTSRGLGRVLGDLAAMGYDARWGVLGAVDAGAPHKRDRIWIVADSNGMRELQPQGREREQRGRLGNGGADLADSDSAQCKGDERPERVAAEHADISSAGWWTTEPDMGRVAYGVAARVDRLRCIGNGQVPAVAALAWDMLTN
jgi:DNA (cytosine-5)-methyltransferase 1